GDSTMLTGKLLRVRYARDRINPLYLDVTDPEWLETAERLLTLFRGQEGRTRGELEEDQREAFGESTTQLVHQGLAKLLEDRCEFEVVSGHPPEQLREAVFRAATVQRKRLASGEVPRHSFDRTAILGEVATALGMTTDDVDVGLFADLKSEQRLNKFRDISPE